MKPIEVLGEGKFLRLERNGPWEYTRRVNCAGAVCIVAVTDAQELVLIRQFRQAVGAMVIEVPAGLVGDEHEMADESFIDAGLRELEEEAGFRATRGELLITFPSCAGLSAESIHMIRAYELTEIHAGGGIGNEQIERALVPIATLAQWLDAEQRAGARIDPKVYMAGFLVTHSK